MVEVAAEFSSWVAPQSKHATDVIRERFHIPSNRRSNDWPPAPVSDGGFPFVSRFWATTTKCRPHCRQSVLLAAAYSGCLKPQCGQSTLTLAGDLATNVTRACYSLGAARKCGLYRRRFFVPTALGSGRGRARIAAHLPARYFGFADEGRPFFDHQ